MYYADSFGRTVQHSSPQTITFDAVARASDPSSFNPRYPQHLNVPPPVARAPNNLMASEDLPYRRRRSSAASGSSSFGQVDEVNEVDEVPTTDAVTTDEATGEAPSPSVPSRRNIDDCIQDLVAGGPAEPMGRLDIPGGDTWVFIKPPSQESGQSSHDFDKATRRYSTPIRVSSQVLRESESALFLKQTSSPTAQFRLIRRCGTTKQQMDLDGIKYVVDLTPPVEGEEAVELTEELSCPKCIVQWVRTSQQWRVSETLVGGQDELVPFSRQPLAHRPDVPDYSPLRHRICIERVLAVLHGQDPVLDSAPKLYTTVMVATKHLGIPAQNTKLKPLIDYVYRWVRAVPNCFIIELHPEAMLKIADELQIEHLCQDTFALLVGEAALELVARDNEDLKSLDRFHDETIHRRTRSNLHEIWETRIEYARDAMVERVNKAMFQDIIAEDMTWLAELPSVRDITANHENTSSAEYANWLAFLKHYVRGAVYHVLCSQYQEIQTALQGFRTGESYDRNVPRDVFNQLTYAERILTRSGWKVLQGLSLWYKTAGWSNLAAYPSKHLWTIKDDDDSKKVETALIAGGLINPVDDQYMSTITRAVQLTGVRDEDALSQPQTTPSDNMVQVRSHPLAPPGSIPPERTTTELPYRNVSQPNLPPAPASEPQPRKPTVRFQAPEACEAEVSNLVVERDEDGQWLSWDAASTSGDRTEPSIRRPLQEVFTRPGEGLSDRANFIWKSSDAVAKKQHLGFPQTQQSSGWESRNVRSRDAPSSNRRKMTDYSIKDILVEAESYLHRFAENMLRQPNLGSLELDTIDSLVCLDENETKVLPLWAGGLDDGSGGVFNNDIPMLQGDDAGFGPGRAGLRSGGSEIDYDALSSIGDSTANTSKLVNDGISIIADRRQVYAASEVESVVHAPPSVASTESWSNVSAMYTPAESVMGELPPEVEEAPEVSDSESGSFIMSSSQSVASSASTKAGTSDAEADEYAAMFVDSDEEDFDEDLVDANDDEEDKKEDDWEHMVVD